MIKPTGATEPQPPDQPTCLGIRMDGSHPYAVLCVHGVELTFDNIHEADVLVSAAIVMAAQLRNACDRNRITGGAA